jgi:hypothetical protein
VQEIQLKGGSESGRRQEFMTLGQQKVSVYKTSAPIFVRKAAVWPVTKHFFYALRLLHCGAKLCTSLAPRAPVRLSERFIGARPNALPKEKVFRFLRPNVYSRSNLPAFPDQLVRKL